MEGEVEEDSTFILLLLQLSLLLSIFITVVEVGSGICNCSVEEWDEGFVLESSIQQLTVKPLLVVFNVMSVSTKLKYSEHFSHDSTRRDARGMTGVRWNVEMKCQVLFKE